MLEGLYEIDWSRLTHPYGDACDIPDLIRNLASDDEDMRSDALDMLSYRVCDESPIETMATVVPFLIELTAHRDVEDREKILNFLAEIAGHDTDDEAHAPQVKPLHPTGSEGEPSALQPARDLAWSRGARKAVESGHKTFLDLLDDQDPKVRIGGAWVLARCRGRAARLIPEVVARIPAQEDPRTRAALILMLDALARSASRPGSVSPLFEGWMRPGEAPVVRLTAALCLARSSPGNPSAEIVGTLCETAEAAWRDFENAAGRAIAFSVGRVLQGDPEARLRFLLGPLDSPDPWVRRGAQSAAAQLAYVSRSITRAVAAAFGERLPGAELQDHSHIVALLSGFGAAAAEAIGPLADALANDDHRVRTNAALALAGLRDPRALPVLIERLESYLPPGASSRSAGRDRAGIRPLVGPMGTDEVFPRITEALGGLGTAAWVAVPTLVDLLRGPPGETLHGRYRPAEIARALGRIGPDARSAIPTLIALMRDRSEARTAAAMAIGLIGSPEARAAIPFLEEWLRSPDEWERVIVAEALWRIDRRADPVLPVLTERLRPGEWSDSRTARVISEMGEAARAAIPALVACLEAADATSSGRWLRLESAVALWRIEHRVDRALPVLIRLLEDPGPVITTLLMRAAEALGEMGVEARAAVRLLRQAAAGDDRSSGRQYLIHDGAISEDDAFLSAIDEALRRIEGNPRG